MNLRRCLWILLLTLCGQTATAAVPLEFVTFPPDSAGGYYVVFFSDSGQAWNPSTQAFATFTSTRDDFDNQATQIGTTGLYRLQVPVLIKAQHLHWAWYKEDSVGTRSHNDDLVATGGREYWSGFSFVDAPDVYETIATKTSQTVYVIDATSGASPQATGSLVGYAVRVSNPTAGGDSGYVSAFSRVIAHSYDSGEGGATVTLESAPGFTTAVGDPLEFYRPGSLVADIVDLIETAGASLSDIDFEDVPTQLTWTLRLNPLTGLVGDKTITITEGTTPKLAIDFRHALAVNGKINEVSAVAIKTGAAGGITFGTAGRERSLAKIPVTAVTPGQYTIRCKITTNTLATIEGDVVLKVVGN